MLFCVSKVRLDFTAILSKQMLNANPWKHFSFGVLVLMRNCFFRFPIFLRSFRAFFGGCSSKFGS